MNKLMKAGSGAPILIAAFASFYLLLLTIAAWLGRSAGTRPARPAATRFAVLIPAHNEDQLIPRLLHCLRQQDYPSTHFTVYVVADNCSDRTGAVARELGAEVFDRVDSSLVGKGYALSWLLDQVRDRTADIDAYAFIDSDCTVSRNFLSAMDAHLQAGEQAVQALYTTLNPYASVPSTLRHAALLLKHDVRARGKAALGLPCGLFGSGMVFSRDLIDEMGWNAHGLAEDAEFQMKLLQAGVRVAFARDAQVWGEMPTSLGAARGQNLRWEAGRLSVALREGPIVIRNAFHKRRWRDLDSVIEQGLPPLSLIGVSIGGLAIASIILKAPAWMVGVAWANVAALSAHVIGGLLICKAPTRMFLAFLYAPVFVAWKCSVYLTAMRKRARTWEPTRRAS